jgi:hypothetical protein
VLLLLLDLHHGKHLLDIEIEVVRLLGMPLDLAEYVAAHRVEVGQYPEAG